MKVAVVSFRTFEYGGVERYAYELVKYLSEKVEVHLFTNKFAGSSDAEIHLIPAVFKKDLFSVNSFMYFLNRRIKQASFDIIHSMGPLFLYPDVVTVHMCQKRLLSRIDNLFSDFSLLRRFYWKIRTRVASGFQKISFNNAKKVIAVSSLLAEEIKSAYDIKETMVIYPGIDKKFFQPVDITMKKTKRKEMGIDDNSAVLLFVGGQWGRKGLACIIKSLSLLRNNAVLLVVGVGDIKKYQCLSEQYGVRDKIIFTGFKKDIIPYYAISDMLVLPSLYESFGYPVLEAMAMGLPVIVSRQVGASELIEEGKTGYIMRDVGDEKELSSFIMLLIEKGLKSFSERARNKARKFTWERKSDEILCIYEEVLEKKLLNV
ncbi:MAG: glycosyltransferase family 1 protein [Candidatus Cloacimonadota bacterium]|nr:MAG: glycosyltransferase family 1 protein [Candidatus Cloacimonadota bacterium]